MPSHFSRFSSPSGNPAGGDSFSLLEKTFDANVGNMVSFVLIAKNSTTRLFCLVLTKNYIMCDRMDAIGECGRLEVPHISPKAQYKDVYRRTTEIPQHGGISRLIAA